MSGVRTVLVEKSTLFSEGLRRIFTKTGFNVVSALTEFNENTNLDAIIGEFDLLIIGSGSDNLWLEENLKSIRYKYKHVKIVILADGYIESQVYLASEFSVSGYLVKTISCSALIKSLELIMLGESIFPSAILMRVASDNGIDLDEDSEIIVNTSPESNATHALSAREMQILKCLVRGQSNKLIGRHLDIVEATVKVHIKAILRKIRVQNRTQAAIWAVNHLDRVPVNTMNGLSHGAG